jgi:hypothetical protein
VSEPADADADPVPKLPRGRGLKFSGPELFRIVLWLGLLIALIVLTKPCSRAVSTFVLGFDGSGGSASAASGSDVQFHLGSAHLIPLKGLSDKQVQETVERAQGKIAGSAVGSGVGSDPSEP